MAASSSPRANTRRVWQQPGFHIAVSVGIGIVLVGYETVRVMFGQHVPLILAVFTAGFLGGVTSSHHRFVSKKPEDLDELYDKRPARLIVQSYVSPAVGGIFALVLNFMWMGRLIEGSLFPAFVNLDGPYKGLTGLFEATLKTNMDAARALVWGFIAGFSERLLPSLIDGLAKKGTNG